MIRLAVFDLDGTLVDSRRDLANAANALVAGLGGRPLSEEAIGRMVGEGAAVLVRRVLTAANLDPDAPAALPRFLELYDERLTEHTVPYGGIVEALDALALRMPLAVLTNKPQRATDRLLESLELAPYFGRVVGGDSMLGRKPEPAGLLSLCTGAGVLPDEAILIGDSPVDLETARRAGTQVLLVSYGFGFRFDPAALETLAVADAPSEIPKHIAS
jgi:phosphoglycolate phosphatase